jgi:acylphosphatase
MWLSLIRAHVFVTGKVQGIGFRFHTRIKARNLGLKGWVRNLESGEVEAIFEGEENQVNNIIEWCKKGPDSALVKDVKVILEKYSEEFEGFDIV